MEPTWSMSQCMVRKNPSALARAKTSANFVGGLSRSSESSPTPMIHALYGQRLHEGGHGVLGGEVAQEAQDQLGRDAQLVLRAHDRPTIARDDGVERHTAAGVRLRVEEHLGVHDALRRGLLQVRPGEVVEVLRGLQHPHRRVVDGEEAREIGEVVGRPHLLHRGLVEFDAVAGGERELQLGLEGALEVQVQLGLGQAVGEGGEIGHVWLQCTGRDAAATTAGEGGRQMRFAMPMRVRTNDSRIWTML